MSQLALLAPPPGLGCPNPNDLCRCGHVRDMHERACTYGHSSRFGGCDCPKFRARGAVRIVEHGKFTRPLGCIVLKRPDTKRPKDMGWALIAPARVTVYLEQLQTKSPNKVTGQLYAMRFKNSRFKPGQIIAMQKAGDAKRCEWAMSAIEQCHVEDRGHPRAVVVTRISRGKLERDNLLASLKFVRDGIAEGLLFDDRLFEGPIALDYKQDSPGAAGVFGVLIEVQW